MSEDRQPNETRLSRKGNQVVPVVRTDFSQQNSVKHRKRTFPGPDHNFASSSKRFRDQEHPAYTPSKSNRFNFHESPTASNGPESARLRLNRQSLPNNGNLKFPRVLDREASPRSAVYDRATKGSESKYNLLPGGPKLGCPPIVSASLQPNGPPENNTSAPFSNAVRKRPSHSKSASLSDGQSRFRSGKITISLEGLAKIEYSDSSHSLAFLNTSSSVRPPTPTLVIDLTSAIEEATETATSSSRLPDIPRSPSTEQQFNHPLDPAVCSTESSSLTPATTFTIEAFHDGQLYNLKKQNGHDKPRRFLTIYDDEDIANISMYGYVDKIHLKSIKQRHLVRVPETKSREPINDACVVKTFNTSIVVMGQSKEDAQVSLLRLDNQALRYMGSFNRPPQSEKSNGISTVCTMLQPHLFATGGFDHAIHLWDIKEGVSAVCGNPLIIKHTAPVHSLLPIRDSSHKLVSAGADCNVNFYDLSAERVVNTLKTSNSVHHLYRTTSPFSTLFQVAHREFQFELRDHRLVPEDPVQRFGFDTSDHKLGRYFKGDSDSNLFAFGDKDGCVRVWDLRNNQKPLVHIECLAGKITHSVFHRSRLVASSEDNHIAVVSYSHCAV